MTKRNSVIVRGGEEDGFTLIELIVAMALSMIVLFAVLTSFDQFNENTARHSKVVDASDQVRRIMGRTVMDLRGAGTLLRANATDLVYTVPASATTTRVERLCTSGNDLYGASRTVAGTPTATSVPMVTSACGSLSSYATLHTTADTSFTYDRAVSSTTPATVRNVGMTFSLDATTKDRAASSTLRASAARRAVAGRPTVPTGAIPPRCDGATPVLTLDVGYAGNGATVSYAYDGTVTAAVAAGVEVRLLSSTTSVVATITDALGATSLIRKDVSCVP